MHIDIDVDNELIERACRMTGIRDKREVIHEALRALIALQAQVEIRALRGQLRWDGDLHAQRLSRPEDEAYSW